jgi:hypothetical protein
LAKNGCLGYNARGWEIYYYKQDGIVRGHGYGSSQLLAHILWGEPEIKPNKIYVIDIEPDPKLNSAFIYWEYFFKECEKSATQKCKENQVYFSRRFHIDDKKSYKEQGELVKEVWSYLEREEEEELKKYLKQALIQNYLSWSKGHTGQEWFSIYDVLSLIMEIQLLMNRPYWHMRNPIILNFGNALNHPTRVSTSLEDWYYNLSKT